jgi:hypothetical protein
LNRLLVCLTFVLAGLSSRAVEKHLPTLVTIGLLEIVSGRATRAANSYRLLAAQGPPRSRPASRPNSLAEEEEFAVSCGLEDAPAISRIFWERHEKLDWQIPTESRQRLSPCRDWRRLFRGFAANHRHAPPAPEGVTVAPARPAPRVRRTREAQSTLIADMAEPVAKRMRDLCDLFRRKYEAPWSRDEMAAFRAAGLDSFQPEDFADAYRDVADHYEAMLCATCNGEKGKDFRRHNLLKLLRNWNTVVENARAFRSRGAIPDRKESDLNEGLYTQRMPAGWDPYAPGGAYPTR